MMILSQEMGVLGSALPCLLVLLYWFAYHSFRPLTWRVLRKQVTGIYLTPKGREEVWCALQGSGIRHILVVVGMPVARAIP